MGEEWVGNAARVGLGLMDADEFKQFASVHDQLEMAASFAPVALFGLGSTSYAAARQAKNYRKTADAMRGVMGRLGYSEEDISKVFDNHHTQKEIADELSPVLQKIVSGAADGKVKMEDYETTLRFAQVAAMDEVLRTAQSIEQEHNRNAVKSEIEQSLGGSENSDKGRFWTLGSYRSEGGKPFELDTVTEVSDESGKQYFNMGESNGVIALKNQADGSLKFVDTAEYNAGLESGEWQAQSSLLNDYLDARVNARIEAERKQEKSALIAQRNTEVQNHCQPGMQVTFGTEDNPLVGKVVENQADGVVVSFDKPVELNGETGLVHKVSYAQVANATGVNVDTRTEDEKEADQATRDEMGRERVKVFNNAMKGKQFATGGQLYSFSHIFEEPYVNEDGTEVVDVWVKSESGAEDVEITVPVADLKEQTLTPEESAEMEKQQDDATEEVAKEDEGTPKDFRGGLLPMKLDADGQKVVDADALWNNDPEAYLRWNDSQNGGNTEDSREMLAAVIAKRQQDRAELEQRKKGETVPSARQSLNAQIRAIDGQISLYGGFLAEYEEEANKAEVARQEAQNAEVKQEPYAKLVDIRQKDTSSEGGDSSISRADNTAPAISLESRGDVKLQDEKDIARPEPTVGSNASTGTTEVIDSPTEVVKGETVDRGGDSSQAISSASEDRQTSDESKGSEKKVAPEETATRGVDMESAQGAESEKIEEAPSISGALLDAIHALYTKGKAYASKLFGMKYFDVVETPNFMKQYGLTGSKFTIRYGVISRHFSKDGSHNITEQEWAKLPNALRNPFAITKLKDEENGYRIYTSLQNADGEYVVVGVDVKNAGRDIEVNAISTVFGRRINAGLTANEDVIYRSKEMTPEQSSLLDQPNSDQYPTEQESSSADKTTQSSETKQENKEKSSEEAPKTMIGDSKRPLSDNEATLRDAIIDLERKSGLDVIDDVESGQRLIDSANSKDVKLEAEAPNAIREQRVYHGSGAEFDHFDHSHIGEGEGNQAYGWGTYVTDVEGIGRTYAGNGENRNLYTVEIPDDNGKNYLDHNNAVDSKEVGRVLDALYDRLVADEESGYDDKTASAELRKELDSIAKNEMTGRDLYGTLSSYLGSDEEASKFLSSLGYTGIKYSADNQRGGRENGAKNYVIFNEADAKITDHVRFFRTSSGEAYGFTVGGKIYIDPRIATSETPVHEYAHLWASALKRGNKAEWQNVVELMKGTSVWEEVKKLYPDLKTDDEIADEVLAQYSGRRGAERLREAARKIAEGNGGVLGKAEAISALQRVKEAVERFWKGVCDFLHIHYTSAEEVADRVMKDLLCGVNPRMFGKADGSLRMSEDEDGRKRFPGKQAKATIGTLTKEQWMHEYVEAIHIIRPSRSKDDIRKELREMLDKAIADAKELYSMVLSGKFNSLTLRKIDEYIDNATNENLFYRPLSKRLPSRVGSSLREVKRENAVDVLFSRISESAIPKTGSAVERSRAQREIGEKKKELLKGWAIATGNWHTSISDFTNDVEPIGRGKDSDVYKSKDGKSVIKVSRGKNEGKKFTSDIDAVTLFNAVFPNSRYEIVGYGEIDGKFVKFLKQPIVNFADDSNVSVEQRVAYMESLGFKPANKEKTAFTNGELFVADLQKGNIVKDKEGNIRVIDADVKLHTRDIGGDYTYPPAENDTRKNATDNIRFQFVGEQGAANADRAEEVTSRLENLSVAREMEDAKKDAKSIKMATGWERGADGKWRYEIPDAKIKDTIDVGGRIDKRFDEDMLWNDGKLGDEIDAPELFKSYPQLKDVKIHTDAVMNDMPSNGEYNSKTNTITIHADKLKYLNPILNHEIQHAIQSIEGFARGGSPESMERDFNAAKAEWKARAYARELEETSKSMGGETNQAEVEKALKNEYESMGMQEYWPDKETRTKGFNYFARGYADKSMDDAIKRFGLDERTRADFNSFQEYKKLAGEVESRNVQSRMNMTEEERKNTLASETEDVSREDQIFLFGEGGVSESRTVFGGNSGYVGYSMSRRAVEARANGKYPKTDFKKEYKMKDATFKALVDAEVLNDSEWHHTSMYGNKTTFYKWDEPEYMSIYEENKAEVDAMVANQAKESKAKIANLQAELDAMPKERPYKYELESAEYRNEYRRIQNESYAKSDAINNSYPLYPTESQEKERVSRLEAEWADVRTRIDELNANASEADKVIIEHNRVNDEYERKLGKLKNAIWDAESNNKREFRTKLYNYFETKCAEMRAAERREEEQRKELERVNENFNQRLDELVQNPSQKNRVLHLGNSSSFLKEAGIADAEIVLEFDKLARKSSESYKNSHPFEASDVKGLPMAIQAPIAVFDNTNGKNAGRVILTELQKDGHNFIVVVQTESQPRKGGDVLEVNSISTLFPNISVRRKILQ